MPAPRASRPLVIGATVLALLGPALPAVADPRAPSASELRAAQDRVRQAQKRVATLRERAEHAAEEYNGAKVAAEQALQRGARQAALAASAERAYREARDEVLLARVAAAAADAWADQADQARLDALAEADRQQLVIDRIAVGAFQTDGQLGMVSQLLLATDPVSLAQTRTVINRIGVHQDQVIVAAQAARVAAEAAVETSRVAREQAVAAQTRAMASFGLADAARDAARQLADAAAASMVDARRSARAAEAAKREALTLVAQAEALLGTARRTAAQMEQLARKARADASGSWDGSAPSEAARTAISWAFEEIGVPYSWGGGDENGPTEGFAQGEGTVGFDCSGLMLFAYGKAGIHLDHYSQSQWGVGQRITSMADVLPGDLLFYAYDTSDPSTIHHVGLSIGNGKMIEAPYTGEVVRVHSAYRSDFIGATRPWA